MAHQNPAMSQQQAHALPPLHPPQRTFSPYQTQQSPGTMSPGGVTLPPAKRPRLSPNPPSSPYTNSPYAASPYATSPTGQYLSLPGTPTNAHAPPPFNQPQAPYRQNEMPSYAPPGSMGPPRVPPSKATDNSGLEKAEKATDINDMSDVVHAAGIDLREEEDYVARTYRNQHQPASFSTSFNSQSSSTVSPNNSFNAWSQGLGGHGAFQGTGPLSQPADSEQILLDEISERHRTAARAVSEAAQYHLTDPFLVANQIRQKLHNTSYEHGIRINVEGLYDKIPNLSSPQNVERSVMTGVDGTSITAIQADSILNRNAPMVETLTLISLAAQERLRGVLEEAYALSRGRQVGSSGVVPPEWASIAVGNGKAQPTTAVPTNLTKTEWEVPDSAVSPMTVPGIKREPDSNAGRLPTPPTDAPPTPQPTISFPNQLASTLRKMAARDRKFEEDRIAARAKRLRSSISSANSPAPGTPTITERMPEKMTKKERDRLNKVGQSEEVLHRNANQTATLALGGGKKKYSWLTGGSGPGGSTPGRINTTVSGVGGPGGVGGPASAQDRALMARDRKFGDFKEDGPKGRGIQIRDLVHVLELDGKERKTLVQVLARLKSTEI